ncbi:MAG TPA: preprotein translocase subunit SecE [candidate division Zixibacteria bacterium]|nr:preprotein translocase subunit SecE [candidate division Zixibacteria bacterium]
MNRLRSMIGSGVNFLREVRTELVKSSWPTRKELVDSTGVVVVAVLLFSVFVGLSDFILGRIIGYLVR